MVAHEISQCDDPVQPARPKQINHGIPLSSLLHWLLEPGIELREPTVIGRPVPNSGKARHRVTLDGLSPVRKGKGEIFGSVGSHSFCQGKKGRTAHIDRARPRLSCCRAKFFDSGPSGSKAQGSDQTQPVTHWGLSVHFLSEQCGSFCAARCNGSESSIVVIRQTPGQGLHEVLGFSHGHILMEKTTRRPRRCAFWGLPGMEN